MMDIIDISWSITSDITSYKDKKTVSITQVKQFDQDGVRETAITMGSHTGTHVDAPSHFLQDGVSIDQIPLKKLIGRCIVLDCTHVEEVIDAPLLQQYDFVLRQYAIVLFKTRNSFVSDVQQFDYSFVYLDASAAEYLASFGLDAVGIDYLGIERNQPDHETHIILMKADTIIIEGLRLQHVAPGEYTFISLPLAVKGIEAAPARAILLPPSILSYQ